MTASIDLSTTYLGFHLPHQFMVGASPLVDQLDTVRRLEDARCTAIVMHSLFEEQITAARSGRIHHIDPLDRLFATVLSCFPEPERHSLGPDEYREQLRRIKSAVKLPVVGSLNGTSAETWLTFAASPLRRLALTWCRRLQKSRFPQAMLLPGRRSPEWVVPATLICRSAMESELRESETIN